MAQGFATFFVENDGRILDGFFKINIIKEREIDDPLQSSISQRSHSMSMYTQSITSLSVKVKFLCESEVLFYERCSIK